MSMYESYSEFSYFKDLQGERVKPAEDHYVEMDCVSFHFKCT